MKKKDQDQNQKFSFGGFYFDRNDPRVFIPERIGIGGFPINFGNVYTYVIIIVIVTLMIFFKYVK